MNLVFLKKALVYIIPAGITILGFILGLIIENAVLKRLTRRGTKIYSAMKSFRGILALWVALIFLRVSLPIVHAGAAVSKIVSRGTIILFLITATILLLRVLHKLIETSMFRALPSTTGLFKTITNVLVWAIGGMIILKSLGIEISPILATLGVGGLAVALALQDTLANLFAGIYIVMAKQIEKGNYIKLDSGIEGYVEDIGWRNTTVRMLANNLVIIPNSKLAGAIITNYYLPETEMSVLVQVGVSYDSDLEKVEKVTVEVAKGVMREVQGAVPEHEPFIRYHTFGDFSINFSVILRAKEFVDQFLIKHEFIKRLHRRYKEEGITIPYPITTVIMQKGGNDDQGN